MTGIGIQYYINPYDIQSYRKNIWFVVAKFISTFFPLIYLEYTNNTTNTLALKHHNKFYTWFYVRCCCLSMMTSARLVDYYRSKDGWISINLHDY
jgi:hypothetical protein